MSKYNEIMARVTVSEEMKNRVMDRLQNAGPTERKTVRFPNLKRYIALAACFVIVLVGVLAATLPKKTPRVDGDLTAGAAVEYQSVKELSRASGIRIKDLKNLPFDSTRTVYLDYRCNLVEIGYSDGTQSLYYRVSKGSGDNSGDYNEYERIETEETGGVTVTLKGSGDLVFCALYEKKGYSYSIVTTAGLTRRQIEAMIP